MSKQVYLNRAAKVEDIRPAQFTENQVARLEENPTVRFIPNLIYVAPPQKPVGVKLRKPFTSGTTTYTHSNHIHLFGVDENGTVKDIIHVPVNSFSKTFFDEDFIEVVFTNGKQSFPNKERFRRAYNEGSLPLTVINKEVILQFPLAFKCSRTSGYTVNLTQVGSSWVFETRIVGAKTVLDSKASIITIYEEVDVPNVIDYCMPEHLKEYINI